MHASPGPHPPQRILGTQTECWAGPGASPLRRPGNESLDHTSVVLTEQRRLKKISNAQLLLKWHWNRFRGKFNIQNPARGRSRQKPVSKLWVKITRAALPLISTESSYPTMLAMLAVLARGHPSSGPLSRTAASQNSWSRSRGAIPSLTNTIALPKPRPSQQTPFYKPGCLVKISKGNATYTDCFKYPNKF